MAQNNKVTVWPTPGILRGATPQASTTRFYGNFILRWFDMNLMRWRGGQAQPVGGSASLPGAIGDSPGRDVLTWHDNSGRRWAAMGTNTKLFVYNFDTQAIFDITPDGVGPLELPGAQVGYGLGDYSADAYGTARDASSIGPQDASAILGDIWSLALWGEDLMFVPTQDGRLFQWLPNVDGDPAAVVENAPVLNAGVFVTEERSVVLIGAGGNPRNVAWCDQENPTIWTDAVDNLAGSKLLETEGRPLTSSKCPGGNLIFTDNDAHLFAYVGPPSAYGITRVGANCGPCSRRAVANVSDVVKWMGVQSFWQYSGTVSPMPSDVGDWMFSLLNRDQIGRVFAAPNPSFAELWWYWPSEGAVECDRYVAQIYGDSALPWMIGVQTRTAADTRGSMLRPVLAGSDGKLYLHEYGWTDDGVSRVGTIYLESADFMLDPEGNLRFHVRQVIPDFTGAAKNIGYRFFTWEQPDGPQFDTGTFPVLDDSGLVDARFSCRGLRMRIEALADGPFALGRTRLDTRPGGKR
jgi:hypothetical protein